MKKKAFVILAIMLLSSMLASSCVVQLAGLETDLVGYWKSGQGSDTTPYEVTIKAYCYTEVEAVSVGITMDGIPTGDNTPHTYADLTGTHTFTVPGIDVNGHPFREWDTCEKGTTITVSSGGTYIAYYGTIHFIMDTIYDPETVDPAWAIDTASRALIFNVYDTLVFFDQEKVDEFLPYLATDWWTNMPPHPDAPAGTNNTCYFEIREGVKFHNGDTLTTEDVEYSFERLMVMDRTGGPAWKIYEPLLGVYHADMGWPETPGNPIDTAVESNATHVWFNLAMPYPPFMQILCGSWASVVNKAFCIAHGCWDGDWINWKAYHNPQYSPLDWHDSILEMLMCGTGPYMLDYSYYPEWSIVAFNKDWTWPEITTWAGLYLYDPAGPNRPHSYECWQQWPCLSRHFDRVTNYAAYDWSVRYTDFVIAGVVDDAYVPTANLSWMIENWPTKWMPEPGPPPPYEWNPEVYPEPISCLPGLPTLNLEAMFFNLDINPASTYVGSGEFDANQDGVGDGIPLDFFSDIRIRKAFAYSFNYTQFLEEAYGGEVVQPSSCIPNGVRYHNPDNPTYYYDPYQAVALFQEASADPTSPAHGVWDTGFMMGIAQKGGHIPSQIAALMLESNIESLFELGPDGIADTGDEPPGTVDITAPPVHWSGFERGLVGYPLFKSPMPLFITGWLNEYTDPHDNVNTFMHSTGHFSRFQSYNNASVDALIEEGIRTPDGPERETTYHQLQLMYYQDVPSVCIAQALKRHWEKDYVQGWYHNPLYPGQKYFYHLWKGLNGDINGDNVVNILDAGKVSAHWYSGPPVGPLGYDKIADIWPELQYIDIPKVWNFETEQWVPHPSIGAVDIFDAALISTHWLEQVDP